MNGYRLGVFLLMYAAAFSVNAAYAADQAKSDTGVAAEMKRDITREEAILAERKRLDEEEQKRAEAAQAKDEEEADAKKRRTIPNPFLKPAK